MAAPASTGSLTGRTARCTRRCPGTTGGGTAVPAAGAAGTIPISGWRCASLHVSNTRRVQILSALTWMPQGRWRRGLTGRRWGCSPCSAGSTGLTRWRMGLSSATGRAAPGGSRRTMGIRSICGGSWA